MKMAEVTGKEIAIYSIIGVGVVGLAALIIYSARKNSARKKKDEFYTENDIGSHEGFGSHEEFGSTSQKIETPTSETIPQKENEATIKNVPPINTNPNANNENAGNANSNNGSQNNPNLIETKITVDSHDPEIIKLPPRKRGDGPFKDENGVWMASDEYGKLFESDENGFAVN